MIEDLIGLPYEMMNCGDLVCIALQRYGRVDPTTRDLIAATAEAFDSGERPNDLMLAVETEMQLVEVDDAEPGDIVFVLRATGREVSHVGIVVGGGIMAHSTPQRGVCLAQLRRYEQAKRIDCIGRTAPC